MENSETRIKKILLYISLSISVCVFLFYLNRFPLRLADYFADFFKKNTFSEWHFPFHLFREGVFILWFSVNCIGLGGIVLDKLKVDSKIIPEYVALAFPIGFLFIALSVFIIGILSLLYTIVFLLLMALISATGIIYEIKNRKLITLINSPHIDESKSANSKMFIIIVMLILFSSMIFIFLSASSPPIQSDGIRYHLTAPQEYLKSHKLIYIPYNSFSNQPFLIEMNFLLAMGLFGDLEAQCVHLLCFAASLFLLYSITFYLVHNKALALLSSLLWATIPSGAILSSWPFIDHGITMFFLLHLYSVMKIHEALKSDTEHGMCKKDISMKNLVALSALSAGGLLGTKYTMAVVWIFSGIAIFFLMFQARQKSGKASPAAPSYSVIFRNIVIFFLISFILFSPWLIKNIIYTSNPFYFLMNSVFKGGEWSAENAKFLADKMAEKGIDKNPVKFITAIYDSVFSWWKYEHFNQGPAFASVSIFLLFVVLRKKYLLPAAYALVMYFLWFFTYQSGRLLMPCSAVLIILSTCGIKEALSFSKFRRVERVIIALLLGISIYSSLWIIRYLSSETPVGFLPSALGFETRDDYLSKSLNYYKCAQYANNRISPPSKLMLIGEHRGYYFQCPYINSDWFDTPILLAYIKKTKNNDELFAMMKRDKIDFVFINFEELSGYLDRYYKPRFSPDEYERSTQFLSNPKLKVIFNDGNNKIIAKITD